MLNFGWTLFLRFDFWLGFCMDIFLGGAFAGLLVGHFSLVGILAGLFLIGNLVS